MILWFLRETGIPPGPVAFRARESFWPPGGRRGAPFILNIYLVRSDRADESHARGRGRGRRINVGKADRCSRHPDYRRRTLRGHLRGDDVYRLSGHREKGIPIAGRRIGRIARSLFVNNDDNSLVGESLSPCESVNLPRGGRSVLPPFVFVACFYSSVREQIESRSIPAFRHPTHARREFTVSPQIGAGPPHGHPLSRRRSATTARCYRLSRTISHSGTPGTPVLRHRSASVYPLSLRSANARLANVREQRPRLRFPVARRRIAATVALSRISLASTREHPRRSDPLFREGVAPPPSCGSPRRDGTRKSSAVCVALG